MRNSAVTQSPFTLQIAEGVLADLRERLARTRWPDEPPDQQPWLTGTNVDYMKDLVAYWRTGFDWRAQENELNRFQQFTVPLAGIDVHFIHERGLGPAPLLLPLPLLLSHGWPGSVFEFRRLIPMLTDPARFGADPDDAFTVVAPSLPGYTLSFQPGQPRFGVEDIADVFAELMTEVLGYSRFTAQGRRLGLVHHFAARLPPCRTHRRHPPQTAGGAVRPKPVAEPHRGGAPIPR